MKKKLALTITSIALVAAVAIGGTLAFLTGNSQVLTNTFTAGAGVSITLDEALVGGDGKALTGSDAARVLTNKYTVTPGATVDKDPKISVSEDGADCYVYMLLKNDLKVTDATKTVATPNFSTEWVKVKTTTAGNDLYKYVGSVANAAESLKVSAGANIPALFDTVVFGSTLTNADLLTLTGGIQVVAYAHQAQDVTPAIADAAAADWADGFTSWTKAEA